MGLIKTNWLVLFKEGELFHSLHCPSFNSDVKQLILDLHLAAGLFKY